jgi:hypothetical protein
VILFDGCMFVFNFVNLCIVVVMLCILIMFVYSDFYVCRVQGILFHYVVLRNLYE